MMLGSTVSSDWKSSPASGWMSILAPSSTSLTATGCRLSVGELAGTTTSTLSRTNVRRISTSTCFGRIGANMEWRRLGVGEAVTHGAQHIESNRHVGERHLTDHVGRGLSDGDVSVDVAQLNVDGGNSESFEHHGRLDAAAARRRGLRGGGGRRLSGRVRLRADEVGTTQSESQKRYDT